MKCRYRNAEWQRALRTARDLRREGIEGGVRVIARMLLQLWEGMDLDLLNGDQQP